MTGIYSKYEHTWYVVVQNRKVTVKGYCITGVQHPGASEEPDASARPTAGAPAPREGGGARGRAPLRMAEASLEQQPQASAEAGR